MTVVIQVLVLLLEQLSAQHIHVGLRQIMIVKEYICAVLAHPQPALRVVALVLKPPPVEIPPLTVVIQVPAVRQGLPVPPYSDVKHRAAPIVKDFINADVLQI